MLVCRCAGHVGCRRVRWAGRSRKDAGTAVDVFTLRDSKDTMQVCLDEVYGFPAHTSHFGGYDA